jgi:hypothetical protein
MPTHHLDDEREPKLKCAPFERRQQHQASRADCGALLSWTNLDSDGVGPVVLAAAIALRQTQEFAV